jgi:hypothetical protein
MTTHVHYRYRAPGSSEEDEIKVETYPGKSPADVLPLIRQVDDHILLKPDYPERHGEGPKEYKVVALQPVSTQTGDDPQTATNRVFVVLTDPEA